MPQDTVHSRRGQWLLPQDTQCLTHSEWYHTLFVHLFSKYPTDIAKGPPSTPIGGRRASQEGFLGGYLCQTLRTMPKRCIYLPEWRRPGMWPGGCIFGGECSPTTLVAVTTSYFSSRNFRQSLVLLYCRNWWASR